MKKLLLCILITLALVGQALGADCGGETPCACGDTVTSSYTLQTDLNCTNAGNCLNAGANDIIIDLNGHTISGDDTNTVSIIDVNNFTGVEIKNGTVEDGTTDGIQFRGTSTGTVNDIVSSSHGNQGFQMEDSAVVTFNRITGDNNADDGFSMHGTGTAVINTGTFDGNVEGINIIDDTTLTAYNITTTGNTTYSIRLSDIAGTADNGPTANFYALIATSKIVAGLKADLLIRRGDITSSGAADHSIQLDPDAGTDGNLDIAYSIIRNVSVNKFGIAGGATSIVKCNNVVFSDEVKTGKGVYLLADAILNNCIFNNLVTGIHRGGGTIVAKNSILYGNTSATVGTVTLTDCSTSDPIFVSATDFNLSAGSPAIGAGIPVTDIHTNATPATDILGRPVLFTPNSGAYDGRTSLTITEDDYTPTGYAVRAGAEIVYHGGGHLDLSGLTDTGEITVKLRSKTLTQFTPNGEDTQLLARSGGGMLSVGGGLSGIRFLGGFGGWKDVTNQYIGIAYDGVWSAYETIWGLNYTKGWL